MKFVITGASSMIGNTLCKALLAGGHEIISVVRSRSAHPVPEGTLVKELSMQDYGMLGTVTGNCDCLIHLAWAGTRGTSRMDCALQQQNIALSMAAVRSMLDSGCKRVVLAGSQAEYGPQADRITEETVCTPNTEYGKAKLSFYQQASALCTAYQAVCIEPRFFSLYGPGDDPNTMVVSTLKKMLSGAPCPFTEGVQMWDYLHIEDACDALIKLCTMLEVQGGIYNFGSGDVRPLRSYIEEMAKLTHTRSNLQFGAVPYPATGIVSLWPDVSKLKRAINWEPQIPFAQGIAEMIESYGTVE